jgi:hypothetical protein
MHRYFERLGVDMVECYQMCVAAHLSPDWKVTSGLTSLTTSYDGSGRPVTLLRLTCSDRLQFINVLIDLHAANVAILSVDMLREKEEIC